MKYLFLFLITFSVIAYNSPNQFSLSNHTYGTAEIEEMTEIFEDQKLNLANYQTTIKETRKISNIKSFEEKIKGYQFNKVADASNKKFQSDTHEAGGINETVLIVRTNKEKHIYQIIYTIESSEATTEGLDLYKKRTKTITNDLFTKNAQKFACAEAWKSDMIDIVRFIKMLKLRLEMTIIDETKESDFYTWTGFTPKWNETLIQDTKEFNMQIAVREGVGDRTTVTIGTPILINEY